VVAGIRVRRRQDLRDQFGTMMATDFALCPGLAMTLGLAPEQGDLLCSTVSCCEGQIPKNSICAGCAEPAVFHCVPR